jgi:CBS domain-containing protein
LVKTGSRSAKPLSSVVLARVGVAYRLRAVSYIKNTELISSGKKARRQVMELREIMTRNPEVISGDASLKEAATKMKNLEVGLIPVCDGDRLQGMLTDRDITIRATANGREPSRTKVAEVMSTDVAYCLEDQEVAEAVSLMETRQIRRLPVLSQDKRLVGIVSLGDIAVHAGDRDLAGETLQAISEPAQPKR